METKIKLQLSNKELSSNQLHTLIVLNGVFKHRITQEILMENFSKSLIKSKYDVVNTFKVLL